MNNSKLAFIKRFTLLSLLLSPVYALANTATASASSNPSLITPGKLGNMIFSIIIVIIAIFVFAYIMRRLLHTRHSLGNAIKLVSALPLNSKERLMLVETNGKLLLIGVTPQNINTLHVFEESFDQIIKEFQQNKDNNSNSLKSFWQRRSSTKH